MFCLLEQTWAIENTKNIQKNSCISYISGAFWYSFSSERSQSSGSPRTTTLFTLLTNYLWPSDGVTLRGVENPELWQGSGIPAALVTPPLILISSRGSACAFISHLATLCNPRHQGELNNRNNMRVYLGVGSGLGGFLFSNFLSILLIILKNTPRGTAIRFVWLVATTVVGGWCIWPDA